MGDTTTALADTEAGKRAGTLEQFHHALQDGVASGRTNPIELTVDLCGPP